MDDQQQVKPGDDLEVQVTDLGPARQADGHAPQPVAGSPLGPRLTRASRATRLATALGALLLVSLLLLGSFPAVRDSATNFVAPYFPTPTNTLEPGGDLFYFLPDVPWGTVLVDR